MSDKDKAPMTAQPATKEDFAPMTAPVVTGKDIMTGKDVVKEVKVPAKSKVFDPTYNTGDRRAYKVSRAVTGSLNNRKFDLKEGESVNLNEDEFALFSSYVEVPK